MSSRLIISSDLIKRQNLGPVAALGRMHDEITGHLIERGLQLHLSMSQNQLTSVICYAPAAILSWA